MEPTSLGGRGLGVRLGAVLVAAAIALTFASLFAPSAHADSNVDEAQFFTLLNAVRAKNGVPPLATDGQLISVARGWSAKMAGDGGLSHNPDIGSQITNWRSLGENVGTGGDVLSIEAALEASPHHFENMVDPNFNYVGIGVVEAGGAIWVTEDFKQAKSGSLPSTQVPASAPKPTPRPPAAPRPAPAPHTSTGPTTRTAPRNPVASPAAATAAASSAGANEAAATPAPSAIPPSGSEPAKSQAANSGRKKGDLPPGLAVVSSSPVMDSKRFASLALFAVLGAAVVLVTQGRLPGVPKLGSVRRR